MMSLTNSKGRALNSSRTCSPSLLALEAAARDILVADYINGTKNTMQGTAKPLVIRSSPGMTPMWFLLAPPGPSSLIWQQRKKPKFVSKTQETDDNVHEEDLPLWRVDSRGNAGFGFWQMAYAGDGTAEPKLGPSRRREGTA